MTELAATAVLALGLSFAAFDLTHRPDPDKKHEKAEPIRKCRWETRYDNTLQQDIHRELVCSP